VLVAEHSEAGLTAYKGFTATAKQMIFTHIESRDTLVAISHGTSNVHFTKRRRRNLLHHRITNNR
jgi:hypothetical protein